MICVYTACMCAEKVLKQSFGRNTAFTFILTPDEHSGIWIILMR